MAEEEKKAKAAEGGKKPPAKAKKEKPPKVEDKPFADFIHQDYLPALQAAFAKEGINDLEVTLIEQKLPIANSSEECWQVAGKFKNGQRQFNVYFPKKDIKGQRAFSCTDGSGKATTLEPFLIDERRITLDLLVFGVVQRLNAQKWLSLN